MAPVRPTESTRTPANPEVRDTESSSNAPVYISYAVGLIGLGVGAGYGYAAKQDHDKLVDKCPDNRCPSDQQGALDSALNKGTIATVGLGVGAAGIVLGTILLLVGGDDEPETATTVKLENVAFQPWVGSDQLGISGKF